MTHRYLFRFFLYSAFLALKKYWKDYPVVGKIVTPPTPREFTVTELRHFDGTNAKLPTNNLPIFQPISLALTKQPAN